MSSSGLNDTNKAENATQPEAPDRNTGQAVVEPLPRQPEDEPSRGQRSEQPRVLDIEQEEAKMETSGRCWRSLRHTQAVPEVVMRQIFQKSSSMTRKTNPFSASIPKKACRHEQPLAVQSPFPNRVDKAGRKQAQPSS